MKADASKQTWPDLSSPLLGPTTETLQLWTQVVGKVRLACTPWVNHSWHATLYVSARGLTTRLIPHGPVSFELEFDLLASELIIRVSDGGERQVALAPGSLSEFYAEVMDGLAGLGVATTISPTPNEMAEATPFPRDTRQRSYDADVARDYWRALVQVDRVLNRFRSRFLGKCSPVHLFWGGFDIAVTRFSGRRAPLHPGDIPHLPDAVTREAYSHEVSSAGFWPAGPDGGPCFYSYAYPAPDGFASAAISPAPARFDPGLGEFLLPYDAVRTARDPDAALLSFLQGAYEAAADLAHWDRTMLECDEGLPRRPRQVD
jgi:hypothetical protein